MSDINKIRFLYFVLGCLVSSCISYKPVKVATSTQVKQESLVSAAKERVTKKIEYL